MKTIVESQSLKILIPVFISILNAIGHYPRNVTVQPVEKIPYDSNSYDLAVILREHGRHYMPSYLSSVSIIAVLRSLDTSAYSFYYRNHKMYDATLLTWCYTQHA